ncbi:MAG: alpha/beta hydrolase [Gammaproteobacteria bacterium]
MTRQLDFVSKVNGRSYRIQVALPFAKAPAAGFPVIYVIDGDGYFGTWAFAARMRAMSDELEPAVVVGIGYPEAETDMMLAMQRRMSELVPSVDAEAVRTLSGSGTGTPLQAGADDLLRILREEVPPLVAGIVPIDRGRQTLFGHSLGGLFALHVLFSHPDAFQTYLVLSPSIWWDDRKVLSGRTRFLERAKRGEVAPAGLFGGGESRATRPEYAAPRGYSSKHDREPGAPTGGACRHGG